MGIILTLIFRPKHTKHTTNSPIKMHGFENMPEFFTQMMNNPDFTSYCNRSQSRKPWGCNRKSTENDAPNKISIPVRRFSPEQINVSMNKAGLMTITASKETTEDSSRNGQRKTTVLVEETCQLPGYLVDNGLL